MKSSLALKYGAIVLGGLPPVIWLAYAWIWVIRTQEDAVALTVTALIASMWCALMSAAMRAEGH